MKPNIFKNFDVHSVPSPCFVVDVAAIERNLQVLHRVQQESGAKILAALKAFSLWKLGPLTSQYLSGTCASGLHEAKLGHDYYPGEVHTFCPAYKEDDLKEILTIANHVVFNSFSQWQRFAPLAKAAKLQRPELQYGLRINPEHSEGQVAIYDPCAPSSRLGITLSEFKPDLLDGITGLHFHTLCEQNYAPLERTLAAVEEKFGDYLPQMQWINFGGGHHISHADYEVDKLIVLIKRFSARYNVQVYLEPGEAIAINSGVLVAQVLDIMHNQVSQAILDTSATCHMPDTLEMPYRPDVFGAGQANEKPYSYRLGGMTCLAGDVINDYSFDAPLHIGQRLMFMDMSHYTMVKTTTFNGIALPSIALWDSRTGSVEVIRRFGYDDFQTRLS